MPAMASDGWRRTEKVREACDLSVEVCLECLVEGEGRALRPCQNILKYAQNIANYASTMAKFP